MTFSKLDKKLNKDEIFRVTVFSVCLLFCVCSTFYFACIFNVSKMIMGLTSIVFVFIPDTAQRLLRFRIQTPLYLFIMLYTVCPLLGYSYNFYHLIPWWDKLLHTFAGVIFAMFGAYLPHVFNKKEHVSPLLCAVFGFFFSVAIAGLWEFVEFGMDSIFHTDMQKDRWISDIYSYLFGEEIGHVGELTDITSVIVNGQPLKGYVDIGLIDSMIDMILETLGAAVYIFIYAMNKGKRFVFLPVEETSQDAPQIAEQTPMEEEAALTND